MEKDYIFVNDFQAVATPAQGSFYFEFKQEVPVFHDDKIIESSIVKTVGAYIPFDIAKNIALAINKWEEMQQGINADE